MTTKTFIQKICCRYVVLNLIAMAVVCTALVYAAMFCADIYTHHGEAIAVPDIRNKKFADAERLLEDAGLVLVVNDTSYNRLLPPDCILQQTPAPGMEVKSGRTVYVTVNSANKPTLVIPDIIDNTRQDVINESNWPAEEKAVERAIELTCEELERYSSNFTAWVDVCKGWRPEEA